MTGYVVYVVQVVAGNLLINYVILWAAGRLGQVRATLIRLFLASSLGSVYSLFLFIPGYHQLFSLPAKILLSTLMVWAAFGPLPVRRLLACLVFFYVASFALGGMLLGFIYFLNSELDFAVQVNQMLSIVNRYFWPGLLLALLTLLGAGRVLARLLGRYQQLTAFQVPLAVELEGSRVEVKALVDTGNSLTDPLTGYPVIVMEYSVLEEILPAHLRQILQQDLDYTSLLAALANTDWAARFRLIPFRSLGQEQGLLVGIRPDAVEILWNTHGTRIDRVVVGIYRQSLNNDLSYRALIPPDLLMMAA